MTQRIVEWIISFVLGIISSIVAEFILLHYGANAFLKKAISLLVQRNGMRRLRNLQRVSLDSNNPHDMVRADWAYALYDLGTSEPESVHRSIEALFYMADLLTDEEKEVAHESLRLRYAANQFRNMDSDYLRAMQKLREE